jgi:phosphoribosylanthranilate isomerase
MKILEIQPGASTSLHRHLRAESLYHVIAGDLLFWDGANQSVRCTARTTVIVEAGENHQLTNVGVEPAIVLEVESPPHHKDDKLLVGSQPDHRRPRPLGRFWSPAAGIQVRTKVCGVRDFDAAWNCFSLGVSAIGVHCVGPARAQLVARHAAWTAAVPPDLSIFLLTDAVDPAEAVTLAFQSFADTVQLQGLVSVDSLARVSELLRSRGWRVVKSLGIRDLGYDQAIALAAQYSQHIDALLLDTTHAGGTGVPNDWGLATMIRDQTQVPVIVAGGLTPETVADVSSRLRPYGVDVESGVEATYVDVRGRTVKARDFARVAAFQRALALAGMT